MERPLICCGFGHRGMLMDIEKPLREVLERLVKEQGVTVFYTGGMGEFDELFARTVRSVKRDCPSIRLVLVMPYLTERLNMDKAIYESLYDEILIPAKLEGVHPQGGNRSAEPLDGGSQRHCDRRPAPGFRRRSGSGAVCRGNGKRGGTDLWSVGMAHCCA